MTVYPDCWDCGRFIALNKDGLCVACQARWDDKPVIERVAQHVEVLGRLSATPWPPKETL